MDMNKLLVVESLAALSDEGLYEVIADKMSTVTQLSYAECLGWLELYMYAGMQRPFILQLFNEGAAHLAYVICNCNTAQILSIQCTNRAFSDII